MKFLDHPRTKKAKIFSTFILVLIYVSVLQVVIEERLPIIFSELEIYFNAIEALTLLVFTVEYIVRIIYSDNRVKYITSFYGIVDALAVVPSLIGFLGLNVASTFLLRIFKIFRLVRLLRLVSIGGGLGGITGKILPYLAAAVAFKSITVILEGESWWPEINHLNVVIGVVGFALAVLLGTKLSVVNARIYSIEDAVCRIVGSLRDMQNNGDIKKDLLLWSRKLEKGLKSPENKKPELIRKMRHQTDLLEEKLEALGIGGPNTAGFHRDVAYLLHRSTAKTPVAYENFLKYVTIAYTLVVIFAVPGLTGLISCILLVYVLGGMYFVIDDMDHPLDYDEDSSIDVRLDALEYYNEAKD